ncbi:hypothetical protein EDC04DRAFT_2503255, partial [Pisolithus marmoratus]
VGIQVMATTGGKALKDDIMQLSEVVHVLASTLFHILNFAGKNITDPGKFPVFIMMRVYSVREYPVEDNADNDFADRSLTLMGMGGVWRKLERQMRWSMMDKCIKSPHEINLMKHLTLHDVTQYCAYVKVRQK